MVKIPKFEELPYAVRKSPRRRWNYIAELLGDGSEDDESSESETPSRNISFTINDGTDPIENASVVIDGTTKTTGSAGGCTFNNIADGSVSVEVSAEGYTTKTEEITVSAENTSFIISLVAA